MRPASLGKIRSVLVPSYGDKWQTSTRWFAECETGDLTHRPGAVTDTPRVFRWVRSGEDHWVRLAILRTPDRRIWWTCPNNWPCCARACS